MWLAEPCCPMLPDEKKKKDAGPKVLVRTVPKGNVSFHVANSWDPVASVFRRASPLVT